MTYEDRKEYNKRYFKENWQQVKLSMPNTEAEALADYCKRHNVSKAGFIRDLIKAAISAERDGASASDPPTRGVLETLPGVGVTPSNSREEEKRG